MSLRDVHPITDTNLARVSLKATPSLDECSNVLRAIQASSTLERQQFLNKKLLLESKQRINLKMNNIFHTFVRLNSYNEKTDYGKDQSIIRFSRNNTIPS